MKKLIIITVVIISNITLFAQDKIKISGVLKDAKTKQIIEFATIELKNKNDSLITGTITNSKGYFSIPLTPGSYRVKINYVGYKEYTSPLLDIPKNKYIGTINLEQDVKALNEILIEGKTVENKVDRDVYIITKELKTGTANTKDLLDKLQGVSYERFNNSIEVDNDDKVLLLVDRLQKDQNYIKNLSPDRIKRIEIIRDPTGRYSTEGYSSVINIILKKDYTGIDIYTDETTIIDLDGSNGKEPFMSNDSYVSSSYTYKKINLYGIYENNSTNFNLPKFITKKYDNGLKVESNPINNDSPNIMIDKFSNNYTFGFDYYINPNNTISIESNFSNEPKNKNIYISDFNTTYIMNDKIINEYNSYLKYSSNSTNIYHTIYYNGKLNDKSKLNMDFTYNYYDNKYINNYTQSDTYKRIEQCKDTKNYTKFDVEFNHSFSDKMDTEIGYANTWKNSNSNNITDATKFKYNDFRNKFYTYFTYNPISRLNVKIGGIFEMNTPEYYGGKHYHHNFQPYVNIKYDVSKKLSIIAKYHTDCNYPSIYQTSIFTSTIDSLTIEKGNPNLSPSVTHKISFKMNLFNRLIFFEPYYHFDNNYISRVGEMNNQGIFEYSYDNIGNYNHFGVEVSFRIHLNKSLVWKSYCNIYKSNINYNQNTNTIKDWFLKSNLIYTNKPSQTVAGIICRKKNHKNITYQGYYSDNNDYWALLLQQPFFKNKLSVMLLYITPISWGVNYNQDTFINSESYSEFSRTGLKVLKNMALINISYRFNSGKKINTIEKNNTIESESRKKSFSL